MHRLDGRSSSERAFREGVCVLQGTFETLSLPEVLGLLASARKSGALWLEAGPMSGVVHVEDGHCRAVETTERRGPVDDGHALLDRLVEVCFDVVRFERGSFKFGADEPAPWRCPEPVELSDALVEVERLLKQWREVVRVIPSLDCRPRLLDALVVDQLVIDRERWSLLVGLDGRRTVRDLVERLGRPALEVCHTLLELVETGAVGIVDADPEPDPKLLRPRLPARCRLLRAERAPEPDPQPVPDPVARARAGPRTRARRDGRTSLVPAAARTRPRRPRRARDLPRPNRCPSPAGAGSDRGAFLRMFSGLRES